MGQVYWPYALFCKHRELVLLWGLGGANPQDPNSTAEEGAAPSYFKNIPGTVSEGKSVYSNFARASILYYRVSMYHYQQANLRPPHTIYCTLAHGALPGETCEQTSQPTLPALYPAITWQGVPKSWVGQSVLTAVVSGYVHDTSVPKTDLHHTFPLTFLLLGCVVTTVRALEILWPLWVREQVT